MPKIQSNSGNDHSEEPILMEERKWNDIPAYYRYFQGNTFESAVSKLVMKLVRHYDQEETDGAVHWKSIGPKLRHAFREKADTPFLIPIDFSISTKEATRPGSHIAKNSQDLPLHIRSFQGHTGGTVIAPELMGHVAIPSRWKEFLFNVDALLMSHQSSGQD